MERLTERNYLGEAVLKMPYECERCGEAAYKLHDEGNGEPVKRLASYEETGLTPERIREMDRLYAKKCRELAQRRETGWIPVQERFPETGVYLLLSFENFSLPEIGRYETDEYGNGVFYLGDEEESCVSQDLFVNAWQPLPEPYREDRNE